MKDIVKYGILYVDDEKSNLRIFRRAFKREFSIFTALSGEEALELLEAHCSEIQLIITDQKMPQMTGVEFLEEILPKYNDKIRMILTGFSDIEDIMHALNKCGIFRYMVKPWKKAEMLTNIEQALEIFKLRKERIDLIQELRAMNESLEIKVKERTAELYDEIDERKKAEQQALEAQQKAEEASQAKEIFLSTMSHEIRTPLNGIIGISTLLKDSPLNEDQTENVQSLQFAGKHLLALINDILDFSKINAGKIELETLDFNIRYVLQEIHKTFDSRAKTKGVSLQLDCAENIPEFVKGDQVRLSQILTNLIGNALKFTDKGSVTTKIELVEQAENRSNLRFSVMDTGIGIPKDKLEAIFENFSQASTDTTRKYGGTGLGLAITRKLVNMHQGKIWVESEFGKGSAFKFHLWLEKSTTTTNHFLKKTTKEKDLQGMHILVAEDNKINTMLVRKFLTKWKAQPEFAENGQVAYEKVQEKDYSIILMDIQMPIMNGYEASKKIRKLGGTYFENIPIIALTASTLAGERNKISYYGMNDYVVKPFEPDDLYDKIIEYTSKFSA